MKRQLLILAIMICASIVNAQSFEFYWPWIKSAIISNNISASNYISTLIRTNTSSTGYVAKVNGHTWIVSFPSNVAGTQAWAWVQANSSRLDWVVNSWSNSPAYGITAALTNAWNTPDYGIWGLDGEGFTAPLRYLVRPIAGFWRITNGFIRISSNWWDDIYWQTNAAGEIIPRTIP